MTEGIGYCILFWYEKRKPHLEQAVSELDDIKTLRSSALDSIGFLTLEMDDSGNMDDLVTEVEKLVDQTQLPSEVETEVGLYDVVGPTRRFIN